MRTRRKRGKVEEMPEVGATRCTGPQEKPLAMWQCIDEQKWANLKLGVSYLYV